jgi:hypothetical protein
LPDLLNSPEGGGHHVVTNRHQLSDYKLVGLDPLVHRVVTPSTASFYLAGESAHYPTAWLDLDGNERASLQLRNSDLNKLHILLLQLASEPRANVRCAAAQAILTIIDMHRSAWAAIADQLTAELAILQQAIGQRRELMAQQPKKWSKEQLARGDRVTARRLANQLQAWQREHLEYRSYVDHLRALLNLHVDAAHPFAPKIPELIPELALGDRNSIRQLKHYAVGPAPGGLILDPRGNLDEERSFRYVDYFSLLAAQRVRNNPQAALSSRPIDFVAMRLPEHAVPGACQAYWLYASEDRQLLLLVNHREEIALRPIGGLMQDDAGRVGWHELTWQSGLPLHLFEDPELRVAPSVDRGDWLSGWHPEREWFRAVHRCLYSNAVIGIPEQFSPVGDNVPGTPGTPQLLLDYERRRRELVEPDFQIFAANHWNFNVRGFNPGGNHGSFFRISTHSVWMMAGKDVPPKAIEDPYDSLNFASTMLKLAGKSPPMSDRVVDLQQR